MLKADGGNGSSPGWWSLFKIFFVYTSLFTVCVGCSPFSFALFNRVFFPSPLCAEGRRWWWWFSWVVVVPCVLCDPFSRFSLFTHHFLLCAWGVLLFLLDVTSPTKPLLQSVSLRLSPPFYLGSLLFYYSANLVFIF